MLLPCGCSPYTPANALRPSRFPLPSGARRPTIRPANTTPPRFHQGHDVQTRHGVSPALPDSYLLAPPPGPPLASPSAPPPRWYRVHHRCYPREPKAARIFSPTPPVFAISYPLIPLALRVCAHVRRTLCDSILLDFKPSTAASSALTCPLRVSRVKILP